MDNEFTREIYDCLKELISLVVPFRNDPQRLLMMDGILLSIINCKYVLLCGLTKQQHEMQKRLVKLILIRFPEYLKETKKYPVFYVESINKMCNHILLELDKE